MCLGVVADADELGRATAAAAAAASSGNWGDARECRRLRHGEHLRKRSCCMLHILGQDVAGKARQKTFGRRRVWIDAAVGQE